MTELSWICVLLAVYGCTAEYGNSATYEGYTVHQITPTSYDHLQELLAELKHLPVDIWHMPHGVNDSIDVMVSPDVRHSLVDIFNKLKLDATQVIDNVEHLFEKERRQIHHARRRATSSISSYTVNFNSYSEIMDFLHQVKNSPSKSSNAKVELLSMGNSTEGRYMAFLKIHSGSNNPNKPAILIDGGIHAREWIAPAVVINFIYQLAFNPHNDHYVNRLLSDFDWYLLPLVNPDGYEQSRTRDRNWRKTMSVNRNMCRGTDANRNFGYHWDPYSGGSTNPCDNLYAGSHAFSIPESAHLGAFMRRHGSNIKAYLTYHSFGQYFLYPFGYSRHAVAHDWRDLESLAHIAVRAMGRYYTIGASGRDLYPAAGGSDDYAKGQCGVKYSYTVELPPDDSTGGYTGFVVDRSQIPIIAAETLNGLKAFAIELAHRENI